MLMNPGTKYIDWGCIKKFMTKMGHQTRSNEVSAIIRRLDIDGDKKIKYSEFVESISAVSPDIMIPSIKQRGPTSPANASDHGQSQEGIQLQVEESGAHM